MSFVATLICNPATPILDDALVEAAGAALPDPQIRVLAPGIAADLTFDPGDLDDPNVAPLGEDILIHDYRNALIATLGEAPVDVVVQPVAHRRKKLLLADMDSTMIAQECIDELADYVGLKPEVAAITERAMRGELPFEPALRERVALLEGLPLATIDEIVEALGWRAHTVRGAMAGALKRKLGLTITSAKVEHRGRVYRIETSPL